MNSLVKKSAKNLSETNKTEISDKIRAYSEVTNKLDEIVNKIKLIEQKVQKYNKQMVEINKTINNLSKKDDISKLISNIDKKLLVDSEGTIKNQIGLLKELIKKRLSKPNMWIPPKGLEKIKNKDKGIEKVNDLYNLFINSDTSLIQPIKTMLNEPDKKIQKIKKNHLRDQQLREHKQIIHTEVVLKIY